LDLSQMGELHGNFGPIGTCNGTPLLQMWAPWFPRNQTSPATWPLIQPHACLFIIRVS
jgi:hypothetical protein